MEEIKTLIAETIAGNLAAYGEIVRRFQDMAYGYAFSIVGDFHLAEDAAQEAFIQAFRELSKLRKPEAFPGWFRTIVFKQCDRITRRRQEKEVPLETALAIPVPMTEPAQKVEDQEMVEKVLQAVRGLPEHERTVTTLFYINGYSQNDIAEFLEVPVTTVKKRLYNSRERLKERMIIMVDETLKKYPLSEDFTDIVVRTITREEDLRDAARFIGPKTNAYHARKHPEWFQQIAEAQKAGLYVVEMKGQAQSAGFFNEFPFSIGSTFVKTVRPREMGFESEGVPSPIFVKGFEGCFKMAKEQGIGLSIVHGSMYDHAFCGFVPSFYYAVATLPAETARAVTTSALIRQVRDAREEDLGKTLFFQNPFATKISAWAGGGPMYVVELDGEKIGYFRMNPDQKGDFGQVSEITVKTRQGALAVIKAAGELAEKKGMPEICILESHMTLITQTLLNLGGKYLLRPSCNLAGLDAEMTAIIDLPLLTQNLREEFELRMHASPAHDVTGQFSFEMSGSVVGFIVNSGRVEIVFQKQKNHRILPRWIITRLYMGYYSGEEVLTLGPLPFDRSDGKTPDNPEMDMTTLNLPENESLIFKALFPKLWPCAMPDPDVWPWVIGQPHPAYQGQERKTPEMKAQINALKFPWLE